MAITSEAQADRHRLRAGVERPTDIGEQNLTEAEVELDRIACSVSDEGHETK